MRCPAEAVGGDVFAAQGMLQQPGLGHPRANSVGDGGEAYGPPPKNFGAHFGTEAGPMFFGGTTLAGGVTPLQPLSQFSHFSPSAASSTTTRAARPSRPQAVVKNTFVEVVEHSDEHSLNRSRSDSDLSRSSHTPCSQLEEFPDFWLPSHLTSSSSSFVQRRSSNKGSSKALRSPKSSEAPGREDGRPPATSLNHLDHQYQCGGASSSPSSSSRLPGGGEGVGSFREVVKSIWHQSTTDAGTSAPSTSEPRGHAGGGADPTSKRPPAHPSKTAADAQAGPAAESSRSAADRERLGGPHPDEASGSFRSLVHSIWQEGSNGRATSSNSPVSAAVLESGGAVGVPDLQQLPAEELIEAVRRECLDAGVAVTAQALQALYDKGLLTQVPRGPNGELTSIGSITHAAAECTPCAYWYKGVCTRAVTCCHCHLPHERQKSKRLRPSKQTRQRMRARLNAVVAGVVSGPGSGDDALGPYEEEEDDVLTGDNPGVRDELQECGRKLTILSL